MEAIGRHTGSAARWGLGLTVLAAAVAMLSGPLYRMNLLALMPAFTLLRWAVYAVIAGALVCLVALVFALLPRNRARAETSGAGVAAAGVLIGLVVSYVPYSMRAANPPPIHDVTTDTDDPPAFVAALAPRRASGATNSPEYDRIVKSPRGGPDFNVPELQKKAFPDIVPVRLAVAPAQAFEQALAAVSAMGWTLIDQDPAEGRIEASDTTTWFGFVDDVVIRVRPDDGGSRIDVRSVSRIGFGDVGQNAKRIRAYVATIEAQR